MRQYYTVEQLRNKMNDLIECGMGERAVSFPITEYEDGYTGDYVLVGAVDTRDALETAIYLQPLDPSADCYEWNKIEDEGNRRLDEEED
jgi:hypothetical protein